MIWFACPKCNKTHGRPDNMVGAMVFCDCGQGLTVPWESTAPEPKQAPSVVLPTAPRVEPLSFGGAAKPAPEPPAPVRRAGRRGARFQHDPNLCFNHDTRPKQKVCDDCELPFCDECVVTFRGQTLCGPCKNYEAKLLQRPPKTASLALVSVLIALASGPLMFCLVPIAGRSPTHAAFMLFALVPQLLAFLAGVVALYKTRSDPRVGGQSLAITGMLTASFTATLAIVLALYAPRVGT